MSGFELTSGVRYTVTTGVNVDVDLYRIYVPDLGTLTLLHNLGPTYAWEAYDERSLTAPLMKMALSSGYRIIIIERPGWYYITVPHDSPSQPLDYWIEATHVSSALIAGSGLHVLHCVH